MPKLSRQTKEIIKTVLVLIIVALLIIVYVIYPLNRTKAIMARAGVDDYNDDSLIINDPTIYEETGLPVDTFRVDSDGLTTLACLYIAPPVNADSTVRGTVFLLHDDGTDRDSLFVLAAALHDSGFAVAAYDQRASGRSSRTYRGDGYYESNDVVELIAYLELRDQIQHPLCLVGYGLGADAAILASQEEKRIDAVAAVNPYLTTQRMQDILRDRHQTYWFPFYRTMMWWWYNIRSGYAAQYRRIDDIQPVAGRTLILIPEKEFTDPEVERLKEVSPPDLLTIQLLAEDKADVYQAIISFVTR